MVKSRLKGQKLIYSQNLKFKTNV